MRCISENPIDFAAVLAAVAHPGAGALVTFAGVARDNFEGRAVTQLAYEGYPAMAQPVLDAVAAEVAERWPGVRLAVVHRVGVLQIGEAAVAVVTAAPHRDAAYAANRYAIDEVKARLPVWKKEHYTDGAAWKANAEFEGEAP